MVYFRTSHLIASALPCKTRNTEITCFHYNPVFYFARLQPVTVLLLQSCWLATYPTGHWPWNFCMWVYHDHSSQGNDFKVEVLGQANAVNLTSVSHSTQLKQKPHQMITLILYKFSIWWYASPLPFLWVFGKSEVAEHLQHKLEVVEWCLPGPYSTIFPAWFFVNCP